MSEPFEWVEDEWQVSFNGNSNDRHVFYRIEDVREFLRANMDTFVDLWDPIKSYRVQVDVMHVVRHHHTPPSDR